MIENMYLTIIKNCQITTAIQQFFVLIFIEVMAKQGKHSIWNKQKKSKGRKVVIKMKTSQ